MPSVWVRRAIAIGLVALSHAALAQNVGFQLNRYEPAPAGDPFFQVEYPWYSSIRFFSGGLTLDYAHDLLVAQHRDAMGNLVQDPAPIQHQLNGHVDLAGSLFDRVALTLSLPVVLYEAGTPFNGVGPTGAVVGDPRIGVRVRFFGQPDGKVSMSGGAYVWVPVGEQGNLAGDATVRVMPRLTIGGLAIGRLRWAANLGLLIRPTARLSDKVSAVGNTVGSELQLGVGLQYLAFEKRLSVGPEANLSITVANDVPAGQNIVALELMAGAHYLLADQVTLGVAAGTGVIGSPGPPDFRFLFSMAYTPFRRRTGIAERVVLVPDEDGHIGAVAVDDGKGVTLLDKAYASTEINRKGQIKPVQSSPQAVATQLGALARVLPPPDRDGDGIPDRDDACPDRAGLASPDPIRNGCPKSTEKVVLLPDEDGHVGGVEVNDGKTTTVIDQPYASAEVQPDGSAHAVPPAPPKTVERSVAALTAQIPAGDRDGDGILDKDDACPDRAGAASPDPLRNGCPPAVEKVVVLPDADGHVGGVEVNDGKSTTVLDKAYATSEVDPSGTAHAAPPSPPKAVERSIQALAVLLPVADRDKDGIPDGADACPDRPGVASSDPLRNGCPKATEKVVLLPDADGHVGGVEVSDGKTTTVLDQAYQSSEVGTDGRARAVPSAPAAVERSIAAVAHAMPKADRDSDGILDKDDACPDRPGVVNPDPTRNGCPLAVEKVVVLPDENGHVGAVEVDDGKQKIVLDQAYATSEVGSDGAAQRVQTEPTEVAKKFAGALAARPPGARMIIYFNAQAEPVSDLTGQIANIVEETRNRPTYAIEVVGHTDHLGGAAANQKLGLQRAQLIADRLIAAGIPAARVRVISKGATQPAFPYKDAKAPEPRNRRVEVFVR